MNKAQQIQTKYDDDAWYNRSSEGCYALAVAAAIDLGGVEVYNSNTGYATGYATGCATGNSTIRLAPMLAFEFDDSSSVYIMYSGVCTID